MTEKTSRIACLGWGSLVWDKRELPTLGDWLPDGPMLPIEFARESSGNRITLVLCHSSPEVQSLWTLLDVIDVPDAVAALAAREGVTTRIASDIGYVDQMAGAQSGSHSATISRWAEERQLEGVVWTNLPCGLKGERGVMPSPAAIVDYLERLTEPHRANAREYIERAPRQIDTSIRRLIKERLGW